MRILKLFVFLILPVLSASFNDNNKINRFDLVNRHNITINTFDSLASLSLGNGNFAFTTDITGLQTFYKEYENGVPLGTQSNWAWHTFPNTDNYSLSECEKYYEFQGRKIPYLHQFKSDRNGKASDYFRENPQRIHLGITGLKLLNNDGTPAKISDIQNVSHTLNLWEGKVSSNFIFSGQKIYVEAYCHQSLDMIAVKVKSSLFKEKKLMIKWEFPYPVAVNTHAGYDFTKPDKHKSIIQKSGNNFVLIKRIIDNDNYYVKIQWNTKAHFKQENIHSFTLIPDNNDEIEFSFLYSPNETVEILPSFDETKKNSIESYRNFWTTGGAVDFSECTDTRAKELERRVILSQYLTKIQSSGNLPPAETGLTYNSWYGKFHLEMHWWHSAHFAAWDRPDYLEKQMEYYFKIFDKAKYNAQRQGFKGVRWPKMVGPDGQDSPSSVGTYLIWQQPHVIYFAEQLYKLKPSIETLNKYKKLVFETAEFMADFVVYDSVTKTYNMLPPLIPAQEHWSREKTRNPPFELEYWHWALSIAQQWNLRLKMPINDKWQKVIDNLAKPAQYNGLYLGTAESYDSYTNPENMTDHPIVLGMVGFLPISSRIDIAVLNNTLDTILNKWNWQTTWGWDYPLVAMCAARLGKPEIALQALLMDVEKNTYLKNGHNYQSQRLRIYLPGNGGLLKTIALMCAGWEGCDIKNPGFPHDGKWNVKWDGLIKDF
jgi:hypothetical protein